MAELHVELVAADREVWSGEAKVVVAKTAEGEMGVLPGHAPVLGVLAEGPVLVRTVEGENVVAAVHGGFLSVADDRVSVLAEAAELASEIDVEAERTALDRAIATIDEDPEAAEARSRAETRIQAVERSS